MEKAKNFVRGVSAVLFVGLIVNVYVGYGGETNGEIASNVMKV